MLHTGGTPYEEGFQHGSLLRDRVRACFLDVWRDGFFRGSPLFPAWIWRAYAFLNRRFLSPDDRAELRGLADGAGMRYSDVLVMNSQGPLEIAHAWLGACSQFAVGGRLVGRTLDTLGFGRLHRYEMLQVHHPARGFPYLTPGYAGKVLDAISGWNARGLHVSQDVAEAPRPNPLGMYSGALMRRVAQYCATLDEAARLLASTRMAAAAKHVLLADGRDARVVDLYNGAVASRAARVLAITNHFTCLRMGASISSRLRLERLEQLVSDKVDARAAIEILTDKLDLASGQVGGPSDNIVNWDGPRIARFGPFAVPPDLDARIRTTCATVSDLSAGTLWWGGGRAYVSAPEDFVPFDVPRLLEG